jgi:hypothetical protein
MGRNQWVPKAELMQLIRIRVLEALPNGAAKSSERMDIPTTSRKMNSVCSVATRRSLSYPLL